MFSSPFWQDFDASEGYYARRSILSYYPQIDSNRFWKFREELRKVFGA